MALQPPREKIDGLKCTSEVGPHRGGTEDNRTTTRHPVHGVDEHRLEGGIVVGKVVVAEGDADDAGQPP
jgi:hypothetical protein